VWIGYEKNEFHKPHDHGPDIERIEVFEFVQRTTSTDETVAKNLLQPTQPRRLAN
jgi:hypothetical protein